MREKIVYKVVKKDGESYISCTIGQYRPKYKIRYKLGKVSKAKAGTIGILVFKKLMDAEYFRVRRTEAILKCKTNDLTKVEIIGSLSGLDAFYSSGHTVERSSAPPGTHACQSLIPVSVKRDMIPLRPRTEPRERRVIK